MMSSWKYLSLVMSLPAFFLMRNLAPAEIAAGEAQGLIPSSTACDLILEATALSDVCDQGIGRITLDVTNGQPPYQVQWSTGETDQLSISGLNAGAYGVTVTDNEGCQGEKLINIANRAADLNQLSAQGDTVCEGEPARVVITGLPEGVFSEHLIDGDFSRASDIYAVDMDRDGDLDVAGTSSSDGIHWYENQGDGSYRKTSLPTSGSVTEQVFAADLDQDMDIDLLTASGFPIRPGIYWFENNGYQQFTERLIPVRSGRGIDDFRLLDLNRDGLTDILASSEDYGDTILWHKNEGAGQFTEQLSVSGSGNSRQVIFPGDINGDEEVDLIAITTGPDYKLIWYQNDGDENFTEQVIVEFNSSVTDPVIWTADVDNDGDIDLLTGENWENDVWWYENLDAGEAFRPHPVDQDLDRPSFVQATDLDSDGDVDILSGSNTDDRIYWYENNGEQQFLKRVLVEELDRPASIFVADADADGDLDVYAAAELGNKIAWYEQPSTLLADPVSIRYRIDGGAVQQADGLTATGDNLFLPIGLQAPGSSRTVALEEMIDANGCRYPLALQAVAVTQSPLTVDLGADTTICKSDTLLLDATLPGARYYWSTGENTPVIQATGGNAYAVTTTDPWGCVATDTIEITPKLCVDCQQVDSLALVDFYRATGGENWRQGWDLQRPVDTWPGIVTNENGCVLVIELTGNQLSGPLPPSLANLSRLEVINLDSNQLSGAIPEFLAEIDSLQFLSLDFNDFTGSIPPELGQLEELEILELAGNQLTGTIPPELGQLTKLRYLGLYSNQLSEAIPREIGDLTNLEYLSLYNNRLTGEIPSALGGCHNLRELYLDENNFEGSITELLGLSELEIFRLSGNHLDTRLTDYSFFWPRLRQFYIQDNRYTFEDFIDLIGSMSDRIASNRRIDEDQFLYAPQDSIFQDTFIVRSAGDSLIIDLGVDEGIISNLYDWYKDGEFYQTVIGENKLRLADLTAADAGLYHCEVTNPNAPSLVLISRPIELSILEVFSAEITPVLCQNDGSGRILLDVRGGNPPYRFLWQDESDLPLQGDQELAGLKAGRYTVVIREESGNEITRVYTVEVADEGLLPQARDDEFTIPSDNTEYPLLVQANDDLSPGRSYTVDLITTPAAGQFTNRNDALYYRADPSYGANLRLTYRICDANCPEICDEAQLLIRHTGDNAFFVPESISPNGDGLNDQLIIPEIRDNPQRYPQREMTLINRWGDVVYYSKPYNNDWDGRSQSGELLPAGTYYYLIRLDVGEGMIKRGSILLVR